MYSNILIPVVLGEGGNTKASFEVARALAADDAHFVVMHVMEDIPAYAASQIPQSVRDNTRREIMETLEQKASGLAGAEAILDHGHVAHAILDQASKRGSDCIIIASHKPGLSNLLLGSTADRVVRHARCAVHVIR